jgi:hypothetical protein
VTADQLSVVILSAVAAGIVSAIGSALLVVAALRVHIEYLRQADDRHEKSITRAHQRIDDIER